MIERWIWRLLLGGLFILAGVLKLHDPTEFAIEVSNYHFMSSLAPYLAVILPSTEIVIGAALLVTRNDWLRAAAWCALALLGIFTVAVTQVVARGINIDCGCFGGASGPVTWLTIARDVALFAVTIRLLRQLRS